MAVKKEVKNENRRSVAEFVCLARLNYFSFTSHETDETFVRFLLDRRKRKYTANRKIVFILPGTLL